MKQELDEQLCQKYPKIFADRNKPMTVTAMCWGFEHSNGWYNILDRLCANIQHHIDWKNKQRDYSIKMNKIREAGKSGNVELFSDLMAEEYGNKGFNESFIREQAERFIREPLKEIEDEVPQVVAMQVKEKFGTLNFYYRGGDDYIRGLVDMAESMSAITCEVCGQPGERRSDGWIKTLCETHQKEREERNLLKEGYEQ